jgi:uncharacterized protein
MPANKIALFSGRLVDPWDLKLSDIDIGDIAHALSQINRYGGHTRVAYSVAQHSVVLAQEARRRWGDAEALYLLLHDAEEAYLYDLARPIKKRPELMHYCRACDRASRVIFAKFQVEQFSEERLGELKNLDDEMVAHEAGSLMIVCDDWAEELRSIQQTFYPRIEMWSSQMAEQQYLKLFYNLYHRDISWSQGLDK